MSTSRILQKGAYKVLARRKTPTTLNDLKEAVYNQVGDALPDEQLEFCGNGARKWEHGLHAVLSDWRSQGWLTGEARKTVQWTGPTRIAEVVS
jgi:hypothetical protein